MELLDISAAGAKFTWSNNCLSNPIMTRLDRFLVNKAWAKLYPRGSTRALPKLGYFKCELAWIMENALDELIKDAWNNNNAQSWSGYVVAKKVRGVKKEMMKWRKEHKVNYKLKVDETLNKIKELDIKEWESGDSIDKELHEWIGADETYCKQRSRIKWLKEGDLNTKFFHATTNASKRTNSIQGIKLDGAMEGDVIGMEIAIIN
ncbi:hypothetical protein AMTRI_Chr12g272610 [Amborella trichopoda]